MWFLPLLHIASHGNVFMAGAQGTTAHSRAKAGEFHSLGPRFHPGGAVPQEPLPREPLPRERQQGNNTGVYRRCDCFGVFALNFFNFSIALTHSKRLALHSKKLFSSLLLILRTLFPCTSQPCHAGVRFDDCEPHVDGATVRAHGEPVRQAVQAQRLPGPVLQGAHVRGGPGGVPLGQVSG